ncbi:SPFH domain-containing protein [Phytohabitans sp. ZYX-F-186]|uniref:SPFH domain-containing protein n=1 Tax=Phytohabitans maris TaxID=3071409 RepID=A0ABU0ZQU0_9ACTN|nr:SPFH domain-containing protein [Phytohabitans sp. ZYX-F-186]MDQ7909390.1 SPFH domain-containing protein [Phytohabitans sp. ZYX-F-186]
MRAGVITILVVAAVVVLIALAMSVRMVQQYERGIVFRFGRVLERVRQPGLRLIVPVADRMVKVSMQTTVVGVPAQGAITRDNVTLTVDAVVYYRVVDPVKVLVNVHDYPAAVLQVAQTSMRSVIGRTDLDTLLSDRERVNTELKNVIDAPTEQPWGLLVERVEVKDVALPDAMKRSMSRQAEAERERRARVISADAEYQASRRLADASSTMSGTPGAFQLRLLQTVVEVAAEKNSTLVMPFPVELLRFFDQLTQGRSTLAQTAGDGRGAAKTR